MQFEVLRSLNLTNNQQERSGAHISIGASSAPVVVLHSGSLSISAQVDARIDILNRDGSQTEGILFKISVDYGMRAAMEDNRIVGSVLNFTPRLTYCSLPLVDVDKINEDVEFLADLLVPSINDVLAEGMPLPNVDGVTFRDAVIHLNDRYIAVAADASYSG